MLLVALLFLLTLELCLLCNKRFEELLPPVASAAVLLCYVLAMFRALPLFQWAVTAGCFFCLLGLAVQAARGKMPLLRRALDVVLTPGLLCFLAIVALYWVSAAPHRVFHTDDIYEWALQPLSLYYRNGLVGPALHLSPSFMTYTPGMHLFQWIGLAAYGEWNEGVLYLWLWVLYAAFLAPLFRSVTWKKAWLIPACVLAAVLLPALFDADAYDNLRVDVMLGLCLGYALIQGWRLATEDGNRLFHGVSMALALSLLALLKQVGLGWAVMAFCLLLLLGNPQRSRKKRLAEGLWVVALPVAVSISWAVYCGINGLSGRHSTALSENTRMLFSGQLALGPVLLESAKALAAATLRGPLPLLLLFALFAGFPVLLWFMRKIDRRAMGRLMIYIAVVAILFVGLFFFFMLTAFDVGAEGPVKAEMLQSLFDNIQRYGCALWYGLLMLYIHILTRPGLADGRALQAKPWLKRGSAILAACCGLLLLANTNWATLNKNLIPGHYTENETSAALDDLVSASFWTDEIPEPQNAVVLLASDSYPYNRNWLQYALAPIKLVMPYDTGLTEERFAALVKENNIQYFVSEGSENELYGAAMAFGEDGYLDPYTVYAVQWQDGQLHLAGLDTLS